MKALMIERPGKMELKDIPIPEYGIDDVFIKVGYCGICGSDIEAFDGTRPEPYIRYPVVLGHEFSGIVEKCGANVKTIMPGDRVTVKPCKHCGMCKYCRRGETNFCLTIRGELHSEIGYTINGGFSEYVVAPERQVYKIPDSLSLELAALVEPGACVWYGLVRTCPVPADTVAVIGPGTLGLLAVSFYQSFHPSKIILIGTREERNELGRKLGATDTINIQKQTPVKILRELTNGEGPDIVFESAGKPEAVRLALEAVRVGGRVALAGVAGKGKKIDIDSDYFIFKGAKVTGVFGYTTDTFTKSIEMLNAKSSDIRKIITHIWTLRDYQEAFDAVRQRREGAIKVLIKL